jgi:hypothetical protein
MRTLRRQLLLCLPKAVLALFALAGGALAQRPETFSESLVVREREILVDLPDNLASRPWEPEDFRVLVDGQPREVTRAEPAAGEWTIVLYIDQVLARPGTIFYSGLALASRARELTRLGSVEIAVAGPDPHVVLPPTREASRIEEILVGLSAAARVERDRSEARTLAAGGPSIPQTRRQLDKLLAFLSDRRPSGPHAAFAVADGPDLSPEQIALLESRDPPAAAETPAFVFHRAARLLAAYGWVTVAVPLRKEGLGLEVAAQSELEILRQGSAPSDHQNSVPPILPGRPPAKTTLAFTGVIDLFIEPETAALRVLSRATAGTVIGFEEQIGPTLAALSRRWRLWIAEPDAPVDGRLRSIEVSLADRKRVGAPFYSAAVRPPDATRKVRAPGWVRSSTPQEIAEVRLGDLLAGRRAAGDLPFTASARRTLSGVELRLEIAPLRLPDSAPSGPVRVSWAFPGQEGAAGVGHETLSGTELEKGIRHTACVVAPPGAREIAVVVEALGPERWGGAVLEIGDAGAR